MRAAQVVVLTPSIGRVEMTICVPEGHDARRRICTHAQVMARYYEARATKPKCSWCEQTIEAGVLTAALNEGDEPRPYCSSSCFIAAL